MIQKHKILVLLLSLLAAIVFWIYVVTTVAPDTTGSVSGIGINVLGDDKLDSYGLMITDMDTSAVTVRLDTTRATLSKLNSSNMSATIDVSRIATAGEYDLSYTISYPDTVNTGEIQLVGKSVDRIHIKVSNVRTRIVPMEIDWDGQVPDGYLFNDNEVTFAPEGITLVGPDYEVDTVARAVAYFDVSDLTEKQELQVQPVFLNADGEEITFSALTSVSDTEVRMTVPVQQYKDLRILANLIYTTGISEEDVEIEMSPETVRVSGEPDVISLLRDELLVGDVNLADAKNGARIKLPLELPRNVQNVSGETEVTVHVKLTGISTREFTVSDIVLMNVPEGYAAEDILDTHSVKVTLRGKPALLNKIKLEDIHIIADLGDSPASGTYNVYAAVTVDGDPAVDVFGYVQLTITLR